VRFYLSEILNASGLEDASSEVSAPVPGWLKTPLKLPKLSIQAPDGDFEKASAAINVLVAQKRYAESAVLYYRLSRKMPGNARVHAGYAISLEKLGAYKAAAAEAKKDLELTPSPEHKTVAAAYIAGLEKHLPLKFTVEKVTLKGRYLAYLGGNITRTDGSSTKSFSGRLGRFISERVDISADVALYGGNAVSDYNGLTLGVSGRYNEPLDFLPLNWTFATKLERVPAPDHNTTFLLSPGLSYFTDSGSLDMYMDFALSGAFHGSRTLSLGYTVYFGGGE
jgi:tetratricopeptide (TPR) repeat protein